MCVFWEGHPYSATSVAPLRLLRFLRTPVAVANCGPMLVWMLVFKIFWIYPGSARAFYSVGRLPGIVAVFIGLSGNPVDFGIAGLIPA